MNSKIAIALIVTACVGALVAAYAALRRGAKGSARRKPSSGGFAWAVLFLSSGRMPPPPPQSQIEEETGGRKNRGVGRDGDT